MSPELWRVWFCRLCQCEARALEAENPQKTRAADDLVTLAARAFSDAARRRGAYTEESQGRLWREGMARLRGKP